MICNWQSKKNAKIGFTRLVNNVVENYFYHTKNNMKLKDLYHSENIAALYERLQMKFFLYYNFDEGLHQLSLR